MRYLNFHTLEPREIASRFIVAARMNSPIVLPEGPLFDITMDKLPEGLAEWINDRKGYVYVAKNEAWPGLFKIGCTRRSVEARMRSLNNAGMATPWEAVVWWHTYDATALEARIHARLGALRMDRELFCASLKDIERYASSCIQSDLDLLEKHLPDLTLPEDFFTQFSNKTLSSAERD